MGVKGVLGNRPGLPEHRLSPGAPPDRHLACTVGPGAAGTGPGGPGGPRGHARSRERHDPCGRLRRGCGDGKLPGVRFHGCIPGDDTLPGLDSLRALSAAPAERGNVSPG
ncbi:MAG: hypothetical protein MZV70_35750 [Desulfobacterales bacterium]|nr:hypothetical protein [Desulfobacterales bacterium]